MVGFLLIPSCTAQQLFKHRKRHCFTGNTWFLKLLTSLRVRSFLCLNNLVTALPIQSMGGPEALFGVWSNLGILCFKPTSSGNDAAVSRSEEDLLESATSAMRACTQKLQESKSSSLFSTLDTSDFQRMVNFASASPHSNVRINMVQVCLMNYTLNLQVKNLNAHCLNELQAYSCLCCGNLFLCRTAHAVLTSLRVMLLNSNQWI